MLAANSYFLGLDLSGRAIKAALINQDGEITARQTVSLNQEEIIEQIVSLAAEVGGDVSPAGIGIAVPGLVNYATKRVEFSTELPHLAGDSFYQQLQEVFNVPVTLENDANAAAYAEYRRGAGQGSRDMFYAMLGEGIGGALILDGNLWRGVSGFAGEFGHITIDAEDDTTLEMMASAANIVRRTKNRLAQDATSSLSPLDTVENFTAYDVARVAREDGDDFALMMMERTGNFTGVALANVINLLNIERIIIGGPVADAAGEALIEPIRRETERLAFGPYFATTHILPAQLGPDAVTLGVALMAREAQDNA